MENIKAGKRKIEYMKQAKDKCILNIDTSSSAENSVSLFEGNKKISAVKSKLQSSQVLIPMIEQILKKRKLKVSDIKEIKINTGPGSFTGLRVGISVANAISWLLKIPINGKQKLIPEPKYK